jgi:hypothetical protein
MNTVNFKASLFLDTLYVIQESLKAWLHERYFIGK